MNKENKNLILSAVFMIIGFVLFFSGILSDNNTVFALAFFVGMPMALVSLIFTIIRCVKKIKTNKNNSAIKPAINQQSIDSNSKHDNLTTKLIHYSGLNGVDSSFVELELDEINNKVYIHANPKHSKGVSEFTLDLDKIIAAGNDVDIQYKQRSGVGRAVAGGLMFGATGAIVGAVTKKDKKITTVYIEIHYISENMPKVLKFKTGGNVNKEIRFFDRLNELININNANEDGSISLWRKILIL